MVAAEGPGGRAERIESRMVDFLVRLQSEDSLLRRYRSEPERTMREFGLTPSERSTVQGGDGDALRSLLAAIVGGDFGKTATIHAHLSVTVHIPPPPNGP